MPTVSFDQIGVWVIIAIVLLPGINQLIQWFRPNSKQDIGPQPFEVKPTAEYVHRREFDSHTTENKKDHDGIHSKIGGVERGARRELEEKFESLRKEIREDMREVREAGEKRAVAIHSRINELGEDLTAQVSKVSGQLEGMKHEN